MSLSINRKIKKSAKLSSSPSLLTNANATITAAAASTRLTRKRTFNQYQQHHYQHKNTSKKSSSLTLLTPALQATSNINADDTLFSTLLEQPKKKLTQSTTTPISAAVIEVKSSELKSAAAKVGHKIFRRTAMPSLQSMSYQNLIALLAVLVCGLVSVNGLKCYMCGQYNEGVGSITPCLNYSEQYAHLYLKECSKKSEKYCVKYVSELSIVRDCATECAEKEIWETQTYCCTEDGCNGSNTIEASAVVIIMPVVFYIVNELMQLIKQQCR